MFLKYTTLIEVTGRGVKQEYSLELQPNWATLSISSLPENAKVFVSLIQRLLLVCIFKKRVTEI